jgi:hypothetical protein
LAPLECWPIVIFPSTTCDSGSKGTHFIELYDVILVLGVEPDDVVEGAGGLVTDATVL